MAVKENSSVQNDGEYISVHRLLATQLCDAFTTGSLDATTLLTLHTLFPGYRLMSMGFPAASPHRALLSLYHAAGDKHTLSRRLMPLGVAAAGMALCERRWFHLAKSALPGLREYWDLDEAFDRHGCEAVLCVPILPELPNWAQPPARPGGPGLEGPLPVLPAFGVLTFGFDASTLVDARLLTSLFLLAHLLAQQLLQEGPNVLLAMCALSLSDSSQLVPCQHPVSCRPRGKFC